MPETGSGHAREVGGGFIPRHSASYAVGAVLGADQATIWQGQNAIGFRVGVAGDVTVTDESGVDVTYYSVQVGERIDLAFSAIKSGAGTTAQKITVHWQ